ncbi:MAG: LacI family DNA-binding transcriptional regulator, partial [Deltaproteobacteria bacterium]|nr:LacI family DNA-binding transcriptional regulator [Deltaproteobacteria bacterium]
MKRIGKVSDVRKKATIKDIAKAANVSATAVSMAMNN